MLLEKKIILIPVKRYYNKTTEEFAGGNGVQGIVRFTAANFVFKRNIYTS